MNLPSGVAEAVHTALDSFHPGEKLLLTAAHESAATAAATTAAAAVLLLGAGVDVLHDVGSAVRALPVVREPGREALGVESVVAGQRHQRLPLQEPFQTHGAVLLLHFATPVAAASASSGLLRRPRRAHDLSGKRVDGRLAETLRGPGFEGGVSAAARSGRARRLHAVPPLLH